MTNTVNSKFGVISKIALLIQTSHDVALEGPETRSITEAIENPSSTILPDDENSSQPEAPQKTKARSSNK